MFNIQQKLRRVKIALDTVPEALKRFSTSFDPIKMKKCDASKASYSSLASTRDIINFVYIAIPAGALAGILFGLSLNWLLGLSASGFDSSQWGRLLLANLSILTVFMPIYLCVRNSSTVWKKRRLKLALPLTALSGFLVVVALDLVRRQAFTWHYLLISWMLFSLFLLHILKATAHSWSADDFSLPFREFADSIPQIMFTAHPTGVTDYYNKRWIDYTGTGDHNGARTWAPWVHPDDIQLCIDSWAKAIDSVTDLHLEFRFLHAETGEYRWHLSRAVPIKDQDGKIVKWLATCSDIHEHKELIKTLTETQAVQAEAEERFRFLAETVPNPIWMASADGWITFVNERWKQYTGLKLEERDRFPDLLHPDDVQDMLAKWTEAVKSASPFESEYRLRRIDGEYRWQLARAVPLMDDNGVVINWFGSCTDVHDQKLYSEKVNMVKLMTIREESARESSRLKSEFLASMSHEIRTPINGVIGMTTFLLQTNLDAEQSHYARAAMRSADSLLSLINDILDFSKIEAGQLNYESIPFEFRSIFEDVKLITSPSIQGKEIEFEFSIDDNIPLYVEGDPGRFRQVLTNLIANSIKFTAEGFVKVSASASVVDGANITIRVEVQDSGIGISAGSRENLFLPFVQADTSTTRKYGGTGLGLSICKNIVESLQGEIGFDSELGVGSRFWFTIPFIDCGDKYTAPLRVANAGVRKKLNKRILVVEDVYLNQFIVTKTLEGMGYSAHAVANGREAIDSLNDCEYDLVLMDCLMPEMDGYEATARIRSNNQNFNSNIPIVAMTVCAMKGDLERCLAAGMNDYLTKPLQPDLLESVIDKWINSIA